MQGNIAQIMRAVVDVEFSDGNLPGIMNALEITRDNGSKLVFSQGIREIGENFVAKRSRYYLKIIREIHQRLSQHFGHFLKCFLEAKN